MCVPCPGVRRNLLGRGGWRLQLGASMLCSTSHSIAQVAAEVGYESEPAFNRAFMEREAVDEGPAASVAEPAKHRRRSVLPEGLGAGKAGGSEGAELGEERVVAVLAGPLREVPLGLGRGDAVGLHRR